MSFAIVDGRIAGFEVLIDMPRLERMGVLDLVTDVAVTSAKISSSPLSHPRGVPRQEG